jgi:solute:Na+ symporter, SSS family
MLRLHPSVLDYAMLGLYFIVVLGIGLAARRTVGTSSDFLLAGRRMPAWVTGLAFVSANLGATEILGMAANGAQYGVVTVHYYWIGAVPAMVFLGIVMMPFYYRSKVRSVPEFLKLRYNNESHVLVAVIFALAAVLIAGVNLFALAIVLKALLGWSTYLGIVVGAFFVLAYVVAGGLASAIYGEVLQFFIIVAALVPLTIVAVDSVGGFGNLGHLITQSALGDNGLHAWKGTGIGTAKPNPIGSNWVGLVFGLGFILSFGYWTTNFAEVQRALSAKDLSAGRRTPLIAAYPKLLIPAVTVIPGLVALVSVKGFGKGALDYNLAIPALMGKLLPSGLLGLAITALFASFMAGVAANVSSLNTVVTYDLVQPYFRPNREDRYYLNVGRAVTVGGILTAVFTAILASHFTNIMNYLQALFGIFNAPIFATFILGMFWKRTTKWAGFWGLLSGVIGGSVVFLLYETKVWHFGSGLAASFAEAGVAFTLNALVAIAITLRQPAPDVSELRGLVYGVPDPDAVVAKESPDSRGWYRRPVLLGAGALVLVAVLDFAFA